MCFSLRIILMNYNINNDLPYGFGETVLDKLYNCKSSKEADYLVNILTTIKCSGPNFGQSGYTLSSDGTRSVYYNQI